MKPDDIQNALNHLDDKIIEETDQIRQNPRGHKNFFQKYQSLVAIFAVVILFGTILGTSLSYFIPNSDYQNITSDGNQSNEGSAIYDKECIPNGSDIESSPQNDSSANNAFVTQYELAQLNFSVQLLQGALKESADENVLISPLSVSQALSMTANGAAGDTLLEMTQVLGDNLDLEDINSFQKNWLTEHISSASENQCSLQLANSIWIRDDDRLTIHDDFLNTNQTYYNAGIYKEPFSKETVKKINNWVKEHTDNKIDKIIEKIDYDNVIYLINALAFDAKWQIIYNEYSIYSDKFYSSDSKKDGTDVEMMRSEEYLYLEDDMATGFIKNYKNNEYRFAAILPNENISLSEYLNTLTGEKLSQLIANIETTTVYTAMPKFEYEYSVKLNSMLQEMGMETAFHSSNANFSNLGYSENGNLYISEVLHKTFISVNESGTEAGAATSVAVSDESAAIVEDPKEVILNRPFLFMILDGDTNLPIFIGTVTHL